MTTAARERARTWLGKSRGALSQAVLADRVNAFYATATPKWSITRDRYSKYESGGAPFGRGVLAKFIAYWAAQGIEAPDFDAEPEPPDTRDPMTRLADAIERHMLKEPAPSVEAGPLAKALSAIAKELEAARLERVATAERLDEMQAALKALYGRATAAEAAVEQLRRDRSHDGERT